MQPAGLDPPQHRPGLAQRGLGWDRRVERAVDGDHIAGADELVQFHVVDVAARAQLGGMQDDEDVVPGRRGTLGTALRSTQAWTARGWKPKDLPQHLGGLLVAHGDVHPDQPVVPGEQLLQLPDRMLLDAVIGYEVNVHGARHLLGAVIPAPFRTAATAPTQPPGGAPK